jgi:phage tail tape-measure protein
MANGDMWAGAGKGALSGAATGATVGSVIPGVGTAIGAGVGGLVGAAAGGLAGRKSKETPMQKKQRELVDELIGSLHGEGPYSDLFTANQADFERSFAEPARARFRNQTSPMIQQSYIAGGQQRSTGLEDKLARAGVDMDQLLNESYMDYVNAAQNRQANAFGQILGQGAGARGDIGYGQAAMEGLGGYVSSDKFGKSIESILDAYKHSKQPASSDPYEQPREGFVNDNPSYSSIGGQP